ncbi:hypothetical protein XENTR_v10019830 [Xenopus tropicalis]|nr:hypothetical protein XENTR_v10019830 [Xenopus tropicalis]
METPLRFRLHGPYYYYYYYIDYESHPNILPLAMGRYNWPNGILSAGRSKYELEGNRGAHLSLFPRPSPTGGSYAGTY